MGPNADTFYRHYQLPNQRQGSFLEVLVPSTKVVAIGVVLLSLIGMRRCRVRDRVQLVARIDQVVVDRLVEMQRHVMFAGPRLLEHGERTTGRSSVHKNVRRHAHRRVRDFPDRPRHQRQELVPVCPMLLDDMIQHVLARLLEPLHEP